jgi:hypothetical protein
MIYLSNSNFMNVYQYFHRVYRGLQESTTVFRYLKKVTIAWELGEREIVSIGEMRNPRFNSQTSVLLDVGATKHASTHRHTHRPAHMRQYTHNS